MHYLFANLKVKPGHCSIETCKIFFQGKDESTVERYKWRKGFRKQLSGGYDVCQTLLHTVDMLLPLRAWQSNVSSDRNIPSRAPLYCTALCRRIATVLTAGFMPEPVFLSHLEGNIYVLCLWFSAYLATLFQLNELRIVQWGFCGLLTRSVSRQNGVGWWTSKLWTENYLDGSSRYIF
jgi:hypothetical protein